MLKFWCVSISASGCLWVKLLVGNRSVLVGVRLRISGQVYGGSVSQNAVGNEAYPSVYLQFS